MRPFVALVYVPYNGEICFQGIVHALTQYVAVND
jgi:hypothetical protein